MVYCLQGYYGRTLAQEKESQERNKLNGARGRVFISSALPFLRSL